MFSAVPLRLAATLEPVGRLSELHNGAVTCVATSSSSPPCFARVRWVPHRPASRWCRPSRWCAASIRGDFAYGSQCLTVPVTEYRPGVSLEMRPCRNSVDQIFEWNVISFEIKIHNLCVDALRAESGSSQPGDPIGLWYCQGTQRQQWFPLRSNPYLPTFSIVGAGGPASTLCLESLKGSTVAGTQLADRGLRRRRQSAIPHSAVAAAGGQGLVRTAWPACEFCRWTRPRR